MNILFLFMTGSKGFGGHHVSTHELMIAFRKLGHECSLISFGKLPSIVFRSDESAFNFIISPFDFSKLKKLRMFIKAKSFDVYFPMDETACRILCTVYPKALSRMIPIKPGWKNVSSWINLTKDFICFSKENVDYMRSLKKYDKVNVHLIPNRVSTVIPDENRINNFRETYHVDEDDFVIFAISRIDPDKTSVFYSAIELSELFIEQGLKVRLFFIGIVSSEETLHQLSSIQINNLEIVSDERYTCDVSHILKAANVIVSMGRTSMESLSQSVPTFVPHKRSEIPVLIDPDSFECLLESNFTYRSIISDEVVRKNYHKIKNIISDYSYISKQSKSLFDKYLNVEMGIKEYERIALEQMNNSRCIFKEFRACIYSYMRWSVSYLLKKHKQSK